MAVIVISNLLGGWPIVAIVHLEVFFIFLVLCNPACHYSLSEVRCIG